MTVVREVERPALQKLQIELQVYVFFEIFIE